MAPGSYVSHAAEALALGLATGPVCLASCGPVVVPWMLTQAGDGRGSAVQLAIFLGGRLTGYLLFAGAAWLAGTAISAQWTAGGWLFGCVQLALAVALLVFVAGWPHRRCMTGSSQNELVQIGRTAKKPSRGAATLGLLTGISLCPPFLVAGVRASQLHSLAAALLFFAMFFVGTALWMAPMLALGFIRRNPAILLVARISAVFLAGYYGIVGFSTLLVRFLHG
jgi:hypothetical protein